MKIILRPPQMILVVWGTVKNAYSALNARSDIAINIWKLFKEDADLSTTKSLLSVSISVRNIDGEGLNVCSSVSLDTTGEVIKLGISFSRFPIFCPRIDRVWDFLAVLNLEETSSKLKLPEKKSSVPRKLLFQTTETVAGVSDDS